MVTRFWPWFLPLVAVTCGYSIPGRKTYQDTLEQVVNWPNREPKIGQVGGVAVDSNNDVYIFHRADRQWNRGTFDAKNELSRSELEKGPIKRNTILKLSPNGKKIGELGANRFFMPHGLTVDKKGNLYVTDVGLHQVMRFPKDASKPDLVLGVAKKPGSDNRHFCKPTDVAVLDDGSFFVADGYCNSRIMQFSPNGEVLQVIENPKGDAFFVPHSLTLVDDMICVADRENNRIQCFNANSGKLVKSLRNPWFGRVFAISYDPKAKVIHLVNTLEKLDLSMKSIGFTVDLDAKILDVWRPQQSYFGLAHDLAVSPSGNEVYVGEVDPARITKFTRVTQLAAEKRDAERISNWR